MGELGFTGTVDDLAAAVATGWGPEGFDAATDTSGNPVLRFEHPDTLVYSQDGVADDVTGVVTALNAVVTAVDWIADGERGEGITLPQP